MTPRPMKQEKAEAVLASIERFLKLERRATDEVGWLQLHFSISRAAATRLHDQARDLLLERWPRALLPRLVGKQAIRYAKAQGLLLSKYQDPTEPARTGLAVAEAEEILKADPLLIYLDPREAA